MRVVVVRHHEGDDPGFIGEAFEARGAEVVVHQLPEDGPLPAFAGIDHVVVLGSKWSVYDRSAVGEWIDDELDWLRLAAGAGVPVLGICFGAQLLAAAFGGRVEPAPRTEIGWTMVDSFDPELISQGPWLQFHSDRCVVPEAARLLAANDVGPQAFAIGRNLAVQFHPEVDGAQLQRWYDDGGAEEVAHAGGDPDEIMAATVAEEPAARERAFAVVESALRLAAAGVG